LDRAAFALFLDLLGEALAARTDEPRIETASTDGALRIVFEPASGEAVIETEDGRFTGPDFMVTITSALEEPDRELASRAS